MIYILVAIDGTGSGTDEKGSAGWRKSGGSNSSVYKFCQDFKTPFGFKKYFDGPSEKLTGQDSIDIYVNAFGFLTDAFISAQKQLRDKFIYIKDWNEQKTEVLKNIQICLIGHSRGGLIAIEIAKKFPLKRTYFMGLYDAVDRQPFFDGSVISNVDVLYHAMRNPDTFSRSLFSNAGTNISADVKSRNTKTFFTSHGGIGGDSEFYFSELTDSSPIQYGAERMADSLIVKTSVLFHHPTESVFKAESMRADSWIRDGAQNAGLPIGNYCSI